MPDLFDAPPAKPGDSYSAKDIEVLEGLEPVRRRPGMYVGGADERGLHHLVAEILDNAMDEAVAGHATRIEIELGSGQLGDRSRQRPRHPGRSASAIPGQIGARSDSDHPAFGRQIRRRGLSHFGRSARRRRLGRQCARRRVRGRGRARPQAVEPELLPGNTENEPGGPRAGAQQARHDGALPSRPGNFRRARLPPGDALPHGAFQGLSVPRSRNSLELRPFRAAPGRRPGRGEASLSRAGSAISSRRASTATPC